MYGSRKNNKGHREFLTSRISQWRHNRNSISAYPASSPQPPANHIPLLFMLSKTRWARSLKRKCWIFSLLLLVVAHQFFANNLKSLTYYYISPVKNSNEVTTAIVHHHHNHLKNNNSIGDYVLVQGNNFISSSGGSRHHSRIGTIDEVDDSRLRRKDGTSSNEIPEDDELHFSAVSSEPPLLLENDEEEEEDPFDWESYTTTCHVLENICRTPNKEWFYFEASKEDDGDRRRRHYKQPMITVMDPSSKVHIDVSSPSSIIPKPTFSQLSSSEELQCTVSPIRHHIVTTGLYSQMMGEYYQKIVLPFSFLMREFDLHHARTNRTSHLHHHHPSSSRSNNSFQRRKGVQLYHHFFEDESRDILPSQELYMNGVPYGQQSRLQSWALTDPSNCTCYNQLVFCGYLPPEEERQNEGWEKNITKLLPFAMIDYTKYNCSAGWGTSAERFTNEGCPIWQDLRTSLIQNYERNNPHLNDDITAYRANLIYTALQQGLTSNDDDDVANSFLREDVSKLSEWRIIGLAQRSDNRHWLNMNETLAQCISQYHEKKIVCVEVDVANLPTNFTSVVSNNKNNEAIILTEVQEQLVLYRSINALIGIHGSHLTQGVLMPAGSIMMELFQWFPRDWGGYQIWGDGWTNCQGNPT